MPYSASSKAAAFVIPLTAHLEATYEKQSVKPTSPAVEEILTIDPEKYAPLVHVNRSFPVLH